MEIPPPLELQWVYGISSDVVRGGVLDLRTDQTKNEAIAYAAGHSVVIYDRSTHHQVLLQGHIHEIQCLSVCPKKTLIVSADCGHDATIIVWNVEDGQVLSSISQVDTGGIVAIDFLKDSEYFVTLSSVGKNRKQKLSLWHIKTATCQLIASTTMVSKDPQTCLHINKDDQEEYVTNGKETVFFWRVLKMQESVAFQQLEIKRQEAVTKTNEIQRNICELTASAFIPNSDSAITAMVSGEVIVWQGLRSPAGVEVIEEDQSARHMHAVKIVRLHHSTITQLTIYNNYVVTGGADGFVRFYDTQLGLVGWFEQLNAGEISSISFSTLGQSRSDSIEITLKVPPFVVGTKKGHAIFLQAAIFEEQPGSLPCKGDELMDCVPKMVRSVTAHPQLPHFAIITENGILQVHDYSTHRICMQREFSKLRAEVVIYSPSGLVVACGFSNGVLKIIDSDTLQERESIAISRSGITKLEFSNDETLLAIADASFAVSVLSCSLSKSHAEDKWVYIGKFRSHARTIVGLHCAKDADGQNRLFSIGQDFMLVEYDLLESMTEKRLKLKGTWPLSAPGLPTSLISTLAYKKEELYLLITDTNFKVRVYDTKEFTCQKKYLGPTFDTPVSKLFRITNQDFSEEYLVFATESQILGIMLLPIEGKNNIQYMGVLGHPCPIQYTAISHDCRFLITIGLHDSIINLWRLNLPMLEAFFEADACQFGPYFGLFDGKDGAKSMQKIKEYFFTAQILSQGEDFPDERVLDRTIKLDQIPSLLSALGYYPSSHDMQEILIEINQNLKPDNPQRITFEDFVHIFINHKPVMELRLSTIQRAFAALGSEPDRGQLNWDSLLNILQTEGERMTREEIQNCLDAILHKHVKLDCLPKEVSASWFANHLLNL